MARTLFPLRLLGWVLPGSDLYTDAAWAALALGWAGWCLLAFLWAPLLVIGVGWSLKLFPVLHRHGATWAQVVRGQSGLPLAAVAWAGALARPSGGQVPSRHALCADFQLPSTAPVFPKPDHRESHFRRNSWKWPPKPGSGCGDRIVWEWSI